MIIGWERRKKLPEYYEEKKIPKYPSSFVLAIYCWAWRLPLRSGLYTQWDSLGKTTTTTTTINFSFGSSCQLETTSDLGMWPYVHFCSQPLRAEPHQARHESALCMLRLCEFICQLILACSEGFVSLVFSIVSCSYSLSFSSSAVVSEAWRECFDKEILLGNKPLKVFTSLHIVQLWFPAFLSMSGRSMMSEEDAKFCVQ